MFSTANTTSNLAIIAVSCPPSEQTSDSLKKGQACIYPKKLSYLLLNSGREPYYDMLIAILLLIWVRMEQGFLSQKGSGGGRGVKEKNLKRTLENETFMDGVAPSATVASEINKGASSRKGLNFHTLITQAGNGADVMFRWSLFEWLVNETHHCHNGAAFAIVDDYSRYIWTRFLKDKTEAFDQFEIFSKKIHNQLGCIIVSIRTDHGREFDNEVQFREFCNANGITHNFSVPRTPQSNGVVERKNMTLQEMSRTMLNKQSLPQKFWCNVVDTSTYILNRIIIRAILGKTPSELLRGRKPTLDYFKVFGSKCFILNTKEYLTKFDLKSYEGVFLGYSENSKAYIIINKHTRKIKESLNVTFDETPPPFKTSPLVDDDLDEEEAVKVTEKKNLENDNEDETLEIDEIVNIKESRNHPLENVIGNLNQRTLRSQAQNQSNFFCFISTIEPKNVNKALADESWIVAMQEELNQFIANKEDRDRDGERGFNYLTFALRLGRYPTSVHVFDDPILFLAGLKPSWEFGQQRPAIIMGGKEMAFRNFIYTEDDDDLAFFTEGAIPMIYVAARIKERKCKTRGGSSRPPVKRKLASESSSSRAVRAKNSTSEP
ncbi:retrovirus-related pol polyprotein from transposon TNT 1-94 [Tanacetum coccineum]